jgi:tetratricopeptide (TPR) repeat protein
MAYDVLTRISDGLGAPRGYLGLAYDADTTARIAQAAERTPGPSEDDEREQVKALLSHAAEVAVGVDGTPDPRWRAETSGPTPVPDRVGASDVEQIEKVTAALRSADYQYGGGACREAVLAQARWVDRLLGVTASDQVRLRLHVSLADLHNLAGWTSLDVARYSAARAHFAQALTHARQANDTSLLANVLYRTGRLHLHRGMTGEALRFFQLGQIAAQDSGCTQTVAMLCANEAWAYALLGDAAQAMRSLDRAGDELARSDPATAAPWVRFFTPIDLQALSGMAHLQLARTGGDHISRARDYLERSIVGRSEGMTRSKTFEVTALATACLLEDDVETGVQLGWTAVELADQVRSTRVRERLQPLRDQAAVTAGGGAADLAQHLNSVLGG